MRRSERRMGWRSITKSQRRLEGAADVCVLLGSPQFTEIKINAFQQAADAIIRKSLEEGFGLVVSGTPEGKVRLKSHEDKIRLCNSIDSH